MVHAPAPVPQDSTSGTATMSSTAKVSRLLRTAQLMASQTRTIHPRWGHVIPAPPRVKISTVEKMFLGTFLCVGMISIPIYVFYNLEYYKAGGRLPPKVPEQKADNLDMVEETENVIADQDVVAKGKAQDY